MEIKPCQQLTVGPFIGVEIPFLFLVDSKQISVVSRREKKEEEEEKRSLPRLHKDPSTYLLV